MKKIVTMILVIALIFGAVLLLKKRKNSVAETATAVRPSFRVKTVKAIPRDLVETRRFLAKLEPVNQAEIASRLSARIGEVVVKESQVVGEGDLLIRIDDTEIVTAINGLKAQLTAAVKQLDYSRALYERNLALFDAGGLAREKLDAAEVSRSSARAAVTELKQKMRSLENQLDYLHIKAPFAGIVGTIVLRQGDLAVPGKPILSLNSLPQKLTFSFMPGRFTIEAGQEVLQNGVTIARISTLYDDARNGLSVAEAPLDKRLAGKPGGSFLTVSVVTAVASGCSVPVQALLHRPEGLSVMLYRNDLFREERVTVAVEDGSFALIDPCVTEPVAVASEAKLSLLPGHGRVTIFSGKNDE